ncbi:MAG TPA: hypothetical protein VJZ71_15520, partial [Phycisphaerae bacterium]|nr:hypothetical protein [Phycisphaerae bacterium]
PGEKLFEELSVRGEDMSPTRHDQIYIWRNRKEDWTRICRVIDELVAAADMLPAEALRERLCAIVPEYSPEPLGDATRRTQSATSTVAPENMRPVTETEGAFGIPS